jgi:hypothetical protein
MMQVLTNADTANIRQGSPLEDLWGDEYEVQWAETMVENCEDLRHATTLLLYQAHLVLRMEYAKSRKKLGQLIETQKIQTYLIGELDRLIVKKKQSMQHMQWSCR